MERVPAERQPDSRGDASHPPTDPARFEEMYAGAPPWDIGRPQPAFLRLAEAGQLRGRVLDVGCGTGEHALMAARLGLPTVGIDAAPTAIERAAEKAKARNLAVRFQVWNALKLRDLGEQFDTVLDSGLLHVFDDAERARFVDALRAVVPPGGRYYLLCFSDQQPGDLGPRRLSQEEIRACFATGWRVDSIEAAAFEVNLGPAFATAAQAWLATITRT